MKLPPYLSAVLASALLTGAAAPIVAPPQPAPSVKPPPAAPPQIIPGPKSSNPNMTNIPKSYLVSGLEYQGGQTFFTGPNGKIVMGPMPLHVVLCGASNPAAVLPTAAPAGTATTPLQRR